MNKKYYWSPSVKWEKEGDKLKIEIFSYKSIVPALFPRFYYLTQRGILLEDLYKRFPAINEQDLKLIVQDFIKKRILINTIQTPKQIFYTQNILFTHDYSEKIRIDNDALEEFKMKQLTRSKLLEKGAKILLEDINPFPDFIKNRRSYRNFYKDKPVSFKVFSTLLTAFRQYYEGRIIRYYYASAGGLYPIDVYLYIKENRVEKVGKGLYYYNPTDNSINIINSDAQITKESQYITNQSIFEESAITIYFIYNAEATMPKYDGMGYFYGIIDSGIMISVLTAIAELNNIGICSIGDMKFQKIQKYFLLNTNQVYLHSAECGLKP